MTLWLHIAVVFCDPTLRINDKSIAPRNIEELEFLVATMCNDFEDYYFYELEPLWHLSVDLSIVKYNGNPEHYKKMNKENALSVAKQIALEYFMKHA